MNWDDYFMTMLQTRDRDGNHIRYKSEDIDFFIVYCAGLPAPEFYVIPACVGIERHSVTMFPHRTRLIKLTRFDFEIYRDAFHLLRLPMEEEQ